MLVLAVSTSTPAVTAGLVEVDEHGLRLLAEQVTVDAHKHGELLSPSIAAVLSAAGHGAHDLTALVCDVGPGPFTGLRVGIVTAAALADALGIGAYAVCGLDAIAVDAGPTDEPLLVATDARRHEVYWATYAGGVRTHGPDVTKPAELSTAAVRATGAGARQYADTLGLPVDGPDHPSPLGLVTVAAERVRAGAPTEVLEPLYLRRPDAVAPAPRVPVSRP